VMAAGNAAYSLVSAREVIRIFDLAQNREKSKHFDDDCQDLRIEKNGDAETLTFVATPQARKCNNLWTGQEAVIVTSKNNKVEKISTESQDNSHPGLTFVVQDSRRAHLATQIRLKQNI